MLIALVETMVFSYSRVMRRESIWFILAVPGHMWMSWQRRARKIVVTRVKEDTGKSQLWRGHCRAHVHTRPTDRLEYSSGSNCRFQIRPGGKDGWNESTAGCRYKRVFGMFCYGGKAVVAVNQVAPLAVRCQKKKGTRRCFLSLKQVPFSLFQCGMAVSQAKSKKIPKQNIACPMAPAVP